MTPERITELMNKGHTECVLEIERLQAELGKALISRYERDQIKALTAEVERLKALLTVANCPECDGSGGRQISEDEAVQCRWCFERHMAVLEKGTE
jgi:uncharacterized small protein (DUF1192 family)